MTEYVATKASSEARIAKRRIQNRESQRRYRTRVRANRGGGEADAGDFNSILKASTWLDSSFLDHHMPYAWLSNDTLEPSHSEHNILASPSRKLTPFLPRELRELPQHPKNPENQDETIVCSFPGLSTFSEAPDPTLPTPAKTRSDDYESQSPIDSSQTLHDGSKSSQTPASALIRRTKDLYKFGVFCGFLKKDDSVEEYLRYMETKLVNICSDFGGHTSLDIDLPEG